VLGLNSFKDKKVMTFLAHPNDEVLGCGGLLSRAKGDGAQIFCVIPVKRIFQSCYNVMEKLDARVAWGHFDDNEMDKYPLLEVCEFFEDYIKQIKPDIVITHHYNCANQDHRVCYKAASIVTKPIKGQIQLLSCEVPSSTGYLRPSNFEPNLYVGLSYEELNDKLDMLKMYKSELRADRSEEVVKALACLRGAESGNDLAEGFMLVRGYC